MLFALDDINLRPEDELRQPEDEEAQSISPPVQRLDGKQDRWAPRYLCIAQPLAPLARVAEDLQIKLSDMGGGTYALLRCSFSPLSDSYQDPCFRKQPTSLQIRRRSPLSHSAFERPS